MEIQVFGSPCSPRSALIARYLARDIHHGRQCEGGGDVVGVLTLLVGGVAQAFHDDRVVELRVKLGVQEIKGKEAKKGRVEVEEENRLKEMKQEGSC